MELNSFNNNLLFLKNVKGKSAAKYANEKYLKDHFIDEYNYIINYCKKYNLNNLPFKQKMYHALNDINSIPKCKNENCNNNVKFVNKVKGYKLFCSKKCANSSKLIKNLKKENNLKKYGVEYTFQRTDIKEKRKQTLKNKYGVETPMDSNEIKEKRKQTNLERYGVEIPTQNDEIKKKISKSVKKIINQNIEKRRQTNLKKYGVEEVLSADCIREKRKQTNLEKYGVEESLSSNIIHEKRRQTNLNRYGVEEVTSLKEFHEKVKQTNQTNYKNKILSENKNVIDVNFTNRTIIYKCNKCNNISELSFYFYYQRYTLGNLDPCLICNPRYSQSSFENEVINFLKSINITNIIQNDRNIINPLELDIVLPDYNIAIEVNGIYWHSELQKGDINYHKNKYLKCKDKEIKLIQIWEDDWKNKQDIVKSRLKNILNKIEYKIYARKCNIKKLTNKEYKIFLENNHLQGYIPSQYKYGLFYNGELVSAMGIGKTRKSLGYKLNKNYELLRFCSKINYNVIGGISKLFKHIINLYDITYVISYANLEWGDGEVYSKLGMKFEKYTKVGYYYVINNIREHRYNWTKHRLIQLGYDKNKSEHDIMLELGYYRCYNAGNSKWIYSL